MGDVVVGYGVLYFGWGVHCPLVSGVACFGADVAPCAVEVLVEP